MPCVLEAVARSWAIGRLGRYHHCTYLTVRYLSTVPNLVGGGSFVIPRPQPPLSHISPISFPPLYSTTPPSTHQIPSSPHPFWAFVRLSCPVAGLSFDFLLPSKQRSIIEQGQPSLNTAPSSHYLLSDCVR